MTKWWRSVTAWIRKLFKMRRKISLYIADKLVDLDDQSFILFNYTMDDLANPTVVKNSFSQQITLKGTPANNEIFGGYFRLDRRFANTGGNSGADFNASQKTPFTIYNEMSEILESGYVKLDSIDRNGEDIEYKVTLYGGLGSFFYALSYDENGNKRTLADLDYLGTSNPETELNFSITKEAVQAAWQRLQGNISVSPIWDIINFAPAYNGIPEGNFAPDKGLVTPREAGLTSLITKDGVKYYLNLGSEYTIVNFAQAHDEWAVKDLRSYLQRPVFSMKAFWQAICNPDNNGGYEVDASVIQDDLTFGVYPYLWMTLPLISSIGTIKQETGTLSLTMSSTASSGNTIGQYNIVGSVPAGTKVTANLNCKIRFNMPSGANAYSALYNAIGLNVGNLATVKFSVLFIQAVAYASDNSIVGGSKIKVLGVSDKYVTAPSEVAAACGYTPAWATDYEFTDFGNTNSTYRKVSAGVFQIAKEMGFTVEAQNVAYYKILVSKFEGLRTTRTTSGGTKSYFSYSGDGSTSTPKMYVDYDTNYTPTSTYIVNGTTANSVTYATSESLRSGAVITKSMLLSTPYSPAEYMLSFCKMFGLYFTYDVNTRKVTILRRNDLYQNETIDLTGRVDLSKGISIEPLAYKAKWYDLILEGAGGAFYDEYLDVEGVPYGIQRVNTGYDFNADAVNLMDSVVFKNACTILAKSKYFNAIYYSYSDFTYPDHAYEDDTLYTGTTVMGSLTKTTQTDCVAIKLQVNGGEQYTITSHGGTSGRAWYVLDINSRVLDMSVADFNTTETVTIPSAAYYLVAQSDTGTITLVKEGQTIFYPSPFLDKGNTFTLWSSNGETLETDISCPPDYATVEYYNEVTSYRGYDINSARKLELRTADNKPIDGSGILVFLEGWNAYGYFKLTDDVPAMDVLNDGVPCWLLGVGTPALNVPSFQRYRYGNISRIVDSLDFGVPRQMDIPGVSVTSGCTIYERGWKNYLADRYDVNTKVMTCKVDFSGMQVGQDLLRKFYWYDNSLWVLNRIINYSLTTYDPVECEFVQVQSKSNYLTGQTY